MINILFNSMSSYPNKVDDLIFFQDCDIENITIMNTYNYLISQGKYSDANAYINQQEGIYGYFADFFKAIENRIYNLQKYLLSKDSKEQPFVYYEEEPQNATEKTIWI